MTKWDPRFPEIFIESRGVSDPNILGQASLLGEEYRARKSILKDLTESKKALSSGISKNSTGLEKQKLINNVQILTEQIKSCKLTLKLTKSKLSELIDSLDKTSDNSLPPLFKPMQTARAPKGKISIETLKPSTEREWKKYIELHPQASAYHSLETRRVVEQTFSQRPFYFMARDETDKIVGVLPSFELKSRLFGHIACSVPYFNYGGPISDSPEIDSQLIDHAWKELRTCGIKHLQLRPSVREFPKLGKQTNKVSMVLKLPNSEDILWRNIGSKLRAHIKKAQRYNLVHRIGQVELIEDFYQVFSRNMRDLGTPVYTRELFRNMLKLHLEATIIVVYFNNKPVSGAFLLGWRQTLEVPWASTIRQANNMDANMFMYWQILKYAITKRYSWFDFGRSNKNESTHKFKKQWGSLEHQLVWYYALPPHQDPPDLSNSNPKFRTAIAIWKKLPLFLTKVIGPSIVKNIP